VSYFDGLPYGRKLIVTGLNQGPFFVMATPRSAPGCCRTNFNLTFDQRVMRDFNWGGRQVTVIADTFNVLNLNKSLRNIDVTGPDFAARRPVDVQNPRAFRITARITF